MLDKEKIILFKLFEGLGFLFLVKYICRDTILVDPILVGQVLAQNVPHNEFFRRVWAKELGFS